jgi:uncharacterized protein involved in outer membrane biogenesis
MSCRRLASKTWPRPMSRSSRIILFAAIGFGGLVLIAAGLVFLVRANVDKARLEATASAALGMEVRVGGRVRLDIVPGLLVTLEDVHVHNRGLEVASAKEVGLGIDLFSLLRGNVLIEKFALKGPRIVIERDRDGRYNVENPEAAEASLPALDWPNISLSDGTLVYADKQFGEGFEAADCRLDVPRLSLPGGKRADLMKDFSFTAELACGQIRTESLTVFDLKLSADAKGGVFDLKPITMRVFGTQGSGSIQADFSDGSPLYHVRCALPQFPIEQFFKALSSKPIAAGPMDFSLNLAMQGETVEKMRQTAQGQISLRGKDLTLSGTDLDQVFERGVAQAQDVAMATRENRIALQGGLDFVNDRFNDVTMALIDAKGCAKVRQKIRGTFQNTVVENPNVVTSAAGPALRLLKKGSDLLLGRKCQVFYAGSVVAPK